MNGSNVLKSCKFCYFTFYSHKLIHTTHPNGARLMKLSKVQHLVKIKKYLKDWLFENSLANEVVILAAD